MSRSVRAWSTLYLSAIAPLLTEPSGVTAQGFGPRLDSAANGRFGISFAARGDVCGSGLSYLRVGGGNWSSGETWVTYSYDGGSGACEAGPVRVLLTRAEGQLVGVRVGAGPVRWPTGTVDLGSASGVEAARFFLLQAMKMDGRIGRELLLPAVLADSGEVVPSLLAATRNRTLSRGLREAAIGWLGRELALGSASTQETIAAGLVRLARDAEEPSGVRTRAISSLAQGEGPSTPALVELSNSPDATLARPALSALGRMADPRAREAVRRAARNESLSEPIRTEAIRALVGRDATPGDFTTLRQLWPSLTGSEIRGNLLDAVGEAGGAENLRWLLELARDPAGVPGDRARAIRAAAKAGVQTADLTKLYDSGPDRQVKEALLESLFRIADRSAMDKLFEVAQKETDMGVRRSVVTRLARSGDPRAKQVLRDVVEQ